MCPMIEHGCGYVVEGVMNFSWSYDRLCIGAKPFMHHHVIDYACVHNRLHEGV